MALFKCSECGKDISDKAPACPNCGNPINSSVVQIANAPDQNFHVEPELTSKKWKMVKIISWVVIASGFILPAFLEGSVDSRQSLGWTIVFFGVVGLIVGKIGAWYADKRTR